jgi:hypothetical protein
VPTACEIVEKHEEMPTGLEETAALVGVVGFGFQCLAGCITGFQLLSAALSLGKQAVYLRVALLLEEQKLLLWARRSGLNDEKPDPKLPWNIINETFANLSELLSSVEKLTTRYKFKVETSETLDSSTTGDEYAGLANDEFSFLMTDEMKAERLKIQQRAKAIQHDVSKVKKFWFAAIDKPKFRELLEEIGNLIENLHELLSDRIQDELRESSQLQQYQNVVLVSKIDELKAMIEANSLKNLMHLPENSAALLKFIEISGKSGPNSQELKQLLSSAMMLSHNSLQPIIGNRFENRELLGSHKYCGTLSYDGKQYFFETKRYDWTDSEAGLKKVEDSIVKLALLLNAPKHPSFHTLNCFGTLSEASAGPYLFLYRWPGGRKDSERPRTLLEYLSSSYKPSLTVRFQLARSLAKSIFLFHTANWMHKAFSSNNVLFFPPSSTSPRSLDDPYIVGFAYSRPDQKDEPSMKLDQDSETDIYRHPECLEEDHPFHKSYDIYSLGLVLLEIAKWRPLKELFLNSARELYFANPETNRSKMTQDELRKLDQTLIENCRAQDIRHMRKKMLDRSAKDNQAVDVAFRAGDVFAEAVFNCVGDDFAHFRRGEDHIGLQDMFFRKVLKPLDVCR